ncbi:hypothetical protein J5N97_003532 [Dioscorea zingiberensis]|uniref:Uncharacterized protein n=1 Tax=Dioscorea zingiberensis TaxID=325984 RepID=A0A9D5D4D6_9LILI|nr:hypothetical protein J5N97_003532 [Dioscorea zingiberensis]
MDFLKVKRFPKFTKSKGKEEPDPENSKSPPEGSKEEITDSFPKSTDIDPNVEAEDDDDDDDFITNEVKKRLKELRKNTFMVLIPEEEPDAEEEEEEEEEETSSSEWRESEVEDGYPWCGFDTLYDKYCERMLFFDKMIAQQLQEAGSQDISSRSPRSASKKLAMTIRNLSFKKRDELQDDREHLHHSQEDPYQNLETAYVAHISLSWEALHCQYMQLSQRVSSQPENPTSYCYAAQAFQQFQVLLQRFIENEPFEQGSRVEVYARSRTSLPRLLQIPSFQGLNHKGTKDDYFDSPILAPELIKIMEDSILTFCQFLKMDKKKSGSSLNLFGGHDQLASSLHQVQSSLDKKEIRVKELSKKKKGWKKKSWPTTPEEVDLLFALIDIKVISRVMRMAKISKEQLLCFFCSSSRLSNLGFCAFDSYQEGAKEEEFSPQTYHKVL